MSAIFKAPIAAIVFALEVIMLDLTLASLVPLLVASVTAALTSYLFMGQNILYAVAIQESFIMKHVPYYIVLGIFAGFMSVYFTRIYMFVTGIFERINSIWFRLPLLQSCSNYRIQKHFHLAPEHIIQTRKCILR